MNVVIAIDSFKGSMTSMQAGLSAATGIKRVYKDAHITVRPLADGGEGTVDVWLSEELRCVASLAATTVED